MWEKNMHWKYFDRVHKGIYLLRYSYLGIHFREKESQAQFFLKKFKTMIFYRIELVSFVILRWSLCGLLLFVRKGQHVLKQTSRQSNPADEMFQMMCLLYYLVCVLYLVQGEYILPVCFWYAMLAFLVFLSFFVRYCPLFCKENLYYYWKNIRMSFT